MERITETTQQPGKEGLVFLAFESSALDSSSYNITITHEPSRLFYASKVLIDIVIASIAIVVLMPLFFIIALCIKLDDGGDTFYFREMIGFRGKRFFIIKFRTMIPNAESYLANRPELMQEFQQNMKLRGDPRVTRIGGFLRKTYLDELPQLFNVLVGQMSLVGPRAIHENELALYGEYAQKRHSVKPGLTGLWQINPNRHNSYGERIPLDMQYIDERSFIFDLTILLKTVKVVLAHSGV